MNDYNYRILKTREGKYRCQYRRDSATWCGMSFAWTELQDAVRECRRTAEIAEEHMELQPILEFEE